MHNCISILTVVNSAKIIDMKIKLLSLLRSIIDFVIFSNLFIAISVMALSLETMFIFGISDSKYPILIFFLTLFVYCFHRIYRLDRRSYKEQLEGRHVWVKKNRKLFIGILFSSILGAFCCIFLWTNLSTFITLLPIAAITLTYSIPCIKTSKKLLRLRDIKGVKIFAITLVLGLTTVILPLIFYDKLSSISLQELLFVLLRRFLFIFAITLPFDIRDVEYDQENDVKTIPIMLGINKSKQLAILVLIIFIILALAQRYFFNNLNFHYMVSLILSAAITIFLITKIKHQKKELFYPIFIEGTMLLQFLLVAIF